MDNSRTAFQTVFGCEYWWAPESRIKEMIVGRTVEYVQVSGSDE